MRLCEEAKQQAKHQISPEAFWTTVVAAIVLVGIMPVPNSFSIRWVSGTLLLAVWSGHLWSLFRFGWRSYSWDSVAMLVAVTLLLGQEIWLPAPAIGAWMENAAIVVALAGLLAHYLRRKQRLNGGSHTS